MRYLSTLTDMTVGAEFTYTLRQVDMWRDIE